MSDKAFFSNTPEGIVFRLRRLKKNQTYLSKKFNRPQSQISMAINSNAYPTLTKKIITHIIKLEAKNNV